MFGRATITFGIGPHSSLCLCLLFECLLSVLICAILFSCRFTFVVLGYFFSVLGRTYPK